MKKLYFAILISAAVLIGACKKTVTLDLKTADSQIVIEGNVTDSSGPYTVSLTKTVAFYTENNFPAISGAVVKISDNQGVTDSLTETSPRIYSTSILQGAPGHTYTLSVVANNTTYTATSTMPAHVPFDSLTVNKQELFGDNRISATVNFQDPIGIHNYYQFTEYINGAQYNKSLFVFDDRLSDGKYISINLFNDSTRIKAGDHLAVDMYCIDVNVYNYFNQLDQSSGTGAFNTTASPANPSSNINNGAYGYFSAHTAEGRTIIVE